MASGLTELETHARRRTKQLARSGEAEVTLEDETGSLFVTVTSGAFHVCLEVRAAMRSNLTIQSQRRANRGKYLVDLVQTVAPGPRTIECLEQVLLLISPMDPTALDDHDRLNLKKAWSKCAFTLLEE